MRRIFGAGEARNFKFGIWIDPGKSHLTNKKIFQKVAQVVQGPGAEFLNFKPPSVNLERVMLETSNSVNG